MKASLPVLVTAFIVTLSIATAHAAGSHTVATQYEDTAYIRVITQRSAKIVAGLGITDSSASIRVRDIIARQYYDLNAIYAERDSSIKAGKDKAAAGQEADGKIAALHGQYLEKLSKVLTPDQVVGVKDGMTYNVVHVTYRAYQEKLPGLTEEQKARILSELVEAREHAMDAESSEKKHAWFGKYKGRINNYLSAQGIHL